MVAVGAVAHHPVGGLLDATLAELASGKGWGNTSRVLDDAARWRLKSSALFLASHGAQTNLLGAFNLIKQDLRAIEGPFFGKIGLPNPFAAL